ncbi:MAG TPA: Gfo/Idh/MocA family oxidoreductase [Thermomicrobiales bacterium]|nr:Gfo/Idh/MocA family oxidoreductase [Thermomicrobiales bacterium]
MSWTIGILGLTHDHVWTHLADLARRDDVRLAVAEPRAELRAQAEQAHGGIRLYDDAATLLERERPQAALVFTDNAGSAALVELAASHGAAVMVEKPMADRLANAERMMVATGRAGVPLMVNWPTAWNPAIRQALALASDGEVGEITRFSFRGGHAGPRAFGVSEAFAEWLYDPARNGAGAYMDYCGYGASMARLLLGLPSRVQATVGRLRTDDIPVDDNAVLTLRYPRAMAVVEASWTAAGPVPQPGPIISGARASLVVLSRTASQPARLLRVSAESPEGEEIDVPPLPTGEDTATGCLIARLADGRPIDGLVSAPVGRDTQEILEAGLLAARAGQDMSLPLRG